MATRSPRASKGETRIGNKTKAIQGVLYIMSGKPSQGTVIAGDAVASNGTRTTVYLWPSSDGKWRTGTTFPTDTEAGTVVGTQS
jgi:hypothetical protein